jgi:protein involved in polysaccharide export with SLBB domain
MPMAYGSTRKHVFDKVLTLIFERSLRDVSFPLATLHHVIREGSLYLKFILLTGMLLCGVGCTTAPAVTGDVVPPAPVPAARDNTDTGAIRVGDKLELFVKEDPTFNGSYSVRERGDIIIPDIGRIQLKGLSVETAERRVEGYLEKGQIKDATVILDRIRDTVPGSPVAGARRMLVYLTGEVQKPGQHMLTIPDGRPLGVYEAILISGGLGRFADEQKVHVLRMDNKRVRHRIPVDIKLIKQGNSPDPAIGHGDVIVVPEKVFGF